MAGTGAAGPYYLGIDVGGTSIKAGVVTATGVPLTPAVRVETEADLGPEAGLDNIEAIAAVPGIDGLFIGPGDLSAALGHLGKQNHPEVVEVIEKAIARIVASGSRAGILMTDETLARHYMTAGCVFTAVGLDTGCGQVDHRRVVAHDPL